MSAESVPIPGVKVNVSLQHDGEPMVLILTSKESDGAHINVSGRGINSSALCALLRVIATTIEHEDDRIEAGPGATDG